MPKAWRKLVKRTNGAVMAMGLIMGLFLAGCLWYVIGLGDALVFRDRMQEAADSVAFSAAVVHARGMNFLVGLNLVMLGMTALYLVTAIVTDITELIQMFVGHGAKGRVPIIGICKFWDIEGPDCTFSYPICLPTFPCECYEDFAYLLDMVPYVGEVIAYFQPIICPLSSANHFLEEAIADNVFPRYYDLIRQVMPVIETVQHGASLATPWVGEVVALTTGSKFKYGHGESGVLGIIAAGSMLPGALAGFLDLTHNEKFAFDGSKLGLPVESLQYRALCWKSAGYPFQFFKKLLGPIAWFPGVSIVIDLLTNAQQAAENWITNRYCDKPDNDKAHGSPANFWYTEGPKAVYSAAKNGNDWMQVWGFILSADAKDQSTNIVELANPGNHQNTPKSLNKTTNHSYVAQAEFYHDCDNSWTNDNCDGNSGSDVGYAMYRIHWRTRLRRVHRPTILSSLINKVNGMVTSGVQNLLQGAVQNIGILGQISQFPGGQQAINAGIDGAVNKAGQVIKNAEGQVPIISTISGSGVINTVIH